MPVAAYITKILSFSQFLLFTQTSFSLTFNIFAIYSLVFVIYAQHSLSLPSYHAHALCANTFLKLSRSLSDMGGIEAWLAVFP